MTQGTLLLCISALFYVFYWLSFLPNRRRPPSFNGWIGFAVTMLGTAGASLHFWSSLHGWGIPLFYLVTVLLVILPAALFRAW